MTNRGRQLGLAAFLLVPVVAHGQEAIVVTHDPTVGCVVAGKYPIFRASFTPASEVAQALVYFRGQGGPYWYYVKATPAPDGVGYIATLPRPNKTIPAMEFYFQATGKGFGEGRTPEYSARVVEHASDCEKEKLTAPFTNSATVAVGGPAGAPVIGFAAGTGIGTGVAVGAAAGALALTGAAIGVSNSGGNTATTTTTTTTSTTTTTTTTSTSTTTTTVPTALNRPPNLACFVVPDPPQGAPGLKVTFRLCGSQDPDGDDLRFDFAFGDGDTAGGSCQADHTYNALGEFPAQACVTDRIPGHQVCCTRRVIIEKPCGTPSTAITGPSGDLHGFSATVTASASASGGIASVSFTATPINPTGGTPILIGTATSAPYSVVWTFPSTCHLNWALTSTAVDTCGNSTVSAPVAVKLDDVCDASADLAVRLLSWTSQLDVPRASGQAILNQKTLLFSGRGRLHGVTGVRREENVIEAQLVEGKGQAGTWRFELNGTPELDPASLRIIAGEVVEVTANSIVFRLTGETGERVGFGFRLRD